MIAVLFALVEVPIEDMIEVIHVPILEPKIINTAVLKLIADPNAIKIPVIAAEL